MTLCAVACALVLALPQAQAQEDELTGRLARIAASAHEAADLHGLSVLMGLSDDVLFERAFGYADPESSAPADDESLYRVGALTEPFAAVALLGLLEEAEQGLDTPLKKVFAELADWEAGVTLRHVLAHTSGLPSWHGALDAAAVAREPASVLAWLTRQAPATGPGTCFEYSPTDSLLVGLAVERLAGVPLPEHLVERLFDPLGMASTRYRSEGPGRHELAPARLEVGGTVVEAGTSLQPFDAGSLCSTARDLLAFQRGLARDRVLSARTLESLLSPQRLADGRETGFGLGLGLSALGDLSAMTYGGALAGSQVHVAWYPAHDLTIVLLANGNGGSLVELERSLARAVFELPEPELVDLELDPEQAHRYCGTFALGCDYYEIRFESGHLECAPPHEPAYRLLSQGYHVFVSAADAGLRITFEMEGERAEAFVLERRGALSQARRLK